jgi:hypothetical protein
MQTISYLKDRNFTGLDDIKDIVNDFYKKKITVSYDSIITSEDNQSRRVIFTCSKTLRNYTFDNIALECNGLLLEASSEGWRPLVVPILSPKTNVNTRKINEWLAEGLFEVYAMEDGTVVNLYYYNNEWTLSTARGIDMKDVKFNNLTYKQLLDESLSQVVEVDAFYNELDKSYCYTLGFKHPDMHPFKEGNPDAIYKVWSIQQVSLLNYNDKVNKFVPERNPIMDNLPTQKKFNFKTRNMHNLYKKLSLAMTDFIDERRPNYGYILVSSQPDITMEFSVLMLESSLMKSIRNLWYNGSYTKFSKAHDYERNNLIFLNSYLDDTRYEIFLSLFPNFAEEFKRLEAAEHTMINDIYALIKETDNLSDYPKVDILRTLADKVKSTLTVDLHDKPLQKIRDVIHSNEFIDAYYHICF